MRKNRILWGLALALLLLAELYFNNVYSLTLLLAGVFLPAVSVLLSLFSRRSLTAQLELQDDAEAGSEENAPTRIVMALHNSSHVSATVTASAAVTNRLTGTSLSMPLCTSVPGRADRNVTLLAQDIETGKIDVALSKVRVTDLLGLVSFRVCDPIKGAFLVPPIVIPTHINAAEVRETGGESEKYSEQSPGPDVSELFGIREYVPGDSLRAVHWKLSSKMDRLYVREFGKQLNYSAVLLVELAEAPPACLEACAVYAANISRGLLDAGICHTLAWYDAGMDAFVSANVMGYEDLDLAVLRLIMSSPHEGPDAALNHFLEDHSHADITSDTIFFYLTTDAHGTRLPEAAASMHSIIRLVGNADVSSLADNGLPIRTLPDRIRDIQSLDITI